VVVPDIDGETDWSAALESVDIVVHLAARVHRFDDTGPNAEAEHRRVNTDATLHLARCAAVAGARRMVFTSSILVMGPVAEAPLTEEDPCHPATPYARSKLAAETGLGEIAAETGLEVVVLRPPLVYGPGVKGNLERLIRLIERGVPLPLARATNRRSLIFVENLADAVVHCVGHPAAAGQTFLVSDGEDLSTADLARRLGEVAGRPARLVPFPVRPARALGRLIGRSADVSRLFDSLQADTAKARAVLGWQPPHTMEEGLRRTFAGEGPAPG
jgi:nucleoside-diphosphate-sugar epimerase